LKVLLESSLRSRGRELQHQVCRRDEARLDAGHHRPVRERRRQVALAHAAVPEQHDVLGALDEGEACELLDLRAGRAGGEAEVVLLQRLDRRQRGELQQRCTLPFASCIVLNAERSFEEVGEARLVPGGLLGEMRPVGADALELELRAHQRDAFVLQVMPAPPAATPGSAQRRDGLEGIGCAGTSVPRLQVL